jgi:perosamine synthetase
MQPYEKRFAEIFGPDSYAFSFWKGRAALYAILQALELRQGDEVILPGYTCVAVANAIRYAGAKPVYADIAPGHYNLDPASVKKRLTAKTRAVIVQHTYGIPADIGSLQAIAEQHRLELIEDCAHVLPGSKYQGKLLGSFGKASFFSSQWSKPYTTGLGGVAVTRDRELGERLKAIHARCHKPALLKYAQLQIQYALYRKFFQPKLYWFSQKSLRALSQFGMFVGSSSAKELTGKMPSDLCWRMGAFQQRAGLAHLDGLQANAAHRQTLAKYYSQIFAGEGWQTSEGGNCNDAALLRFPLEVPNKTELLRESSRAGVELGSWFETPLHPIALAEHPLIDYRLGSCPVAESTANRVINLPLHERVTPTDAAKITDFVLSHASPQGRRAAREVGWKRLRG